MTSWYVERLLLDRSSIKEGLFNPKGNAKFCWYYPYNRDHLFDYSTDYENYYEIYFDNNFESDLYNDLITVEIKMEEMIEKNLLTDRDIVILRMAMLDKPFESLEKELNISRDSFIKFFKEACSKIGDYIGDYFSDDGYIKHLTEIYKLDEEQTQKLREFITSNLRHRGLTK